MADFSQPERLSAAERDGWIQVQVDGLDAKIAEKEEDQRGLQKLYPDTRTKV